MIVIVGAISIIYNIMTWRALFICVLGSQFFSTLSLIPNHEWDILIFTQHWPLTTCSEWEEKNKDNTCALPQPRDLWTVHGIWPTKLGTIGPQNCNTTWHFNEKLIEPILDDLQNFWINVEKNTVLNSLWKHEWTKHGTCAATLPQLDNELNYFKQGLTWIEQFNMKNILSKANIFPNQQGYSVVKIFNSVKSALNKNPIIECVIDKGTKLSLLSEIRICFDKNLILVDCDKVKTADFFKSDNILTNCNIRKPVMYPNKTELYRRKLNIKSSAINLVEPESKMSNLQSLQSTRDKLLTAYKTIKLLMWATI